MRNRGWRDIVAKILESSTEGNSKTKIMIQVGLSYYQLNKYLEMNIEYGLLMFENKNKTYKITEKGREFLRLYSLINDLIEHEILPVRN